MKSFSPKFIIALTLIAIFPGCAANHRSFANPDTLYQVSTINALLKGDYDGSVSYAQLKTRGDFGLGTFHALDGEMIALDGCFYQVTADGKVHTVTDDMTTPFAAVTFFDSDKTLCIENPMDLPQLRQYLDTQLPTLNVFFAVSIDGQFAYVKTRNVPAQVKPYPPLADVAKNQPTFEFRNVHGTIVGLRCPDYVKGLNVPAWHFHFITDDRSAGGHLLDAVLDSENAAVQIDLTPNFDLTLPETETFYNLNLTDDTARTLKKVEN